MKAKEYYWKVLYCKSETEIESVLEIILEGLTKELKVLINARGTIKDSPKYKNIVMACLRETNMKWQYIVDTWAKDLKANRVPKENPFKGKEFLADAFKAYFAKENPEFSFLFDVAKYEKYIQDEAKRREEMCNSTNMPFYVVTPLNKITDDNITSEILNLLAALGKYQSFGIPLNCIKPLAYRITLLRWWKSNGINYDDILEFEKDKEAWAQAHA